MKIKLPDIEINSAFVFIVVSVLLLPFVYSSAIPDPSLSPRLASLYLIILVFACILLFYRKKNQKKIDGSILKRNIFTYYLIWIVISVLSIFFAINKSEAIFECFKMLAFFIYFVLLSLYLTTTKKHLNLLVKAIILFLILISLRGFYEILMVTSLTSFDHQSSYFIRAFSSNRNLFSQIVFLGLPFSFYGIYRFPRAWKIVSTFALVFGIILIVILLTRSVWIAFLFSALIVSLVLFIYRKQFFANRKFFRVLAFSGLLGLVIIISGIFIYSRIGNVDVFKEQMYWVQNYKFGSSLERVDLWEKTLEMSSDFPVIGVGQGNWRIVFPLYGQDDLRSATGETFFQRPHNDFLWVFSENGIIGLLFYFLIFLATFHYAIKTIRAANNPDSKFLALAMIFGLAGYFVIALFSFPKERVEHQVFLHIIFTVTLISYHNYVPLPKKSKRSGKNLKLVLLILVAIPGLYITANRVVSESHIKKALQFRMGQKWQLVVNEIDKG